MPRKEVDIYYNEQVNIFLDMVKEVKVFKGGRGSGKTRSIPEDILDRAHELPRARIFLASITFDSIDANIMPDIREVFTLHGLIEGEHYVVDSTPPEHFERPYKIIEDPRNSIHLINGFAIQKISMGRQPKKYRGRSFDGGIIDEGLNLRGWDVENILMPTLRGLDRWGDNPYWKMLSVYSSHPRSPEGSWFMKFEKLARQFPELYGWVEATAADNAAVVGEDYIDKQRALLNYIDFQIEVMNQGKIRDLPAMFYHKYNEEKHNYYDSVGADVNPNEVLEVSFDFGGKYSCMTVSQENKGTENFVYEFDTNNITDSERMNGIVKKVPDLIFDFKEKFAEHKYKKVEIWGERMGLNRNEMDMDNTYDKIVRIFNSHEWEAEVMVSYADAALHKSRYMFMNDVFEGHLPTYPRIRINAITCPNLAVALNRTRVTDEFKKDKSEEKNEFANQSHAPHLTDTVDYKVYNKYYFLLDEVEDWGSFSDLGSGIDSF